MKIKIIIPHFLLVLGTCLMTGCSGGDDGDRLTVHPVKGKITLAGSPVPSATVTFSPVDPDASRPAVGRTNDSGEYVLTTYESQDGAASGEYIVLVTKNVASSGGTPESAHEQYTQTGTPPSGHGERGNDGSALPNRYATPETSDLRITIKDGGTESADFDLKP